MTFSTVEKSLIFALSIGSLIPGLCGYTTQPLHIHTLTILAKITAKDAKLSNH